MFKYMCDLFLWNKTHFWWDNWWNKVKDTNRFQNFQILMFICLFQQLNSTFKNVFFRLQIEIKVQQIRAWCILWTANGCFAPCLLVKICFFQFFHFPLIYLKMRQKRRKVNPACTILAVVITTLISLHWELFWLRELMTYLFLI